VCHPVRCCRYKGEFREDKLAGFGEMLYATSGHRYVGEWRNNKKNGKGACVRGRRQPGGEQHTGQLTRDPHRLIRMRPPTAGLMSPGPMSPPGLTLEESARVHLILRADTIGDRH
jgi:hypothetical protein